MHCGVNTLNQGLFVQSAPWPEDLRTAMDEDLGRESWMVPIFPSGWPGVSGRSHPSPHLTSERLDYLRLVAEPPRSSVPGPGVPLATLALVRADDGLWVEAEGGRILTGGLAEDGSWLVKPTIIVDLPLTGSQYCQEIFGPVVVVNRFETEDEVVHLANDTRYGLNAMLFTENLSRAHRVSEKLRAGTVWVNCFFIRDLRTPFGGVGDSGVGREGGNYSREFFTEPKAVVMQIQR